MYLKSMDGTVFVQVSVRREIRFVLGKYIHPRIWIRISNFRIPFKRRSCSLNYYVRPKFSKGSRKKSSFLVARPVFLHICAKFIETPSNISTLIESSVICQYEPFLY